MIKKISILSLAIIGLFAFTLISCEEDPEETCGYDTFSEVEVTSCCTDDVCVYKFNGKEYGEDEVDELIADMGCSASAVDFKSAQDDNAAIAAQLNALLERVRAEQKRK